MLINECFEQFLQMHLGEISAARLLSTRLLMVVASAFVLVEFEGRRPSYCFVERLGGGSAQAPHE
jgi:hypothetical protein